MPVTAESRFELETQQLHNWCWAAVSSGVHAYVSAGELRQCEVASLLLGQDCCARPEDFNVAETLVDPMRKALEGLPWKVELLHEALTFRQIEAEIEGGRPVCAHISWPAGRGAHFNVIYGYRVTESGHQQVFVSDPFFVDSLMDYNEFKTAYQGEGTWDGTTLLRKAGTS